jgi:hypothetical protein
MSSSLLNFMILVVIEKCCKFGYDRPKLVAQSISYLQAFEILAKQAELQLHDQELEFVNLDAIVGRVIAEDIIVSESTFDDESSDDEDDDSFEVVNEIISSVPRRPNKVEFNEFLDDIPLVESPFSDVDDTDSDEEETGDTFANRHNMMTQNKAAKTPSPVRFNVEANKFVESSASMYMSSMSVQSSTTTAASANYKTYYSSNCVAIAAHTRVDPIDVCVLAENDVNKVKCYNKPIVGVVSLCPVKQTDTVSKDFVSDVISLPPAHHALVGSFAHDVVEYTHQQCYSCRDFGVMDQFQLSSIANEVHHQRHVHSPRAGGSSNSLSQVAHGGSCEVLVVVVMVSILIFYSHFSLILWAHVLIFEQGRDHGFTSCDEFLSNWNKSEILTTQFTRVEDKDIMFVTRDKEILHGHNPRKLVRKLQRQGTLFFIREQCLQDVLGLKSLLIDGFLNVLEGVPAANSFGELFVHGILPSAGDAEFTQQSQQQEMMLQQRRFQPDRKAQKIVVSNSAPSTPSLLSPNQFGSQANLFDAKEWNNIGFPATLSDRFCQLSSTSSEDAAQSTHGVITVSHVFHRALQLQHPHSTAPIPVEGSPTDEQKPRYASSQGLASALMQGALRPNRSSSSIAEGNEGSCYSSSNNLVGGACDYGATILNQFINPRNAKRRRTVSVCFLVVRPSSGAGSSSHHRGSVQSSMLLAEADFHKVLSLLNTDNYFHDIGNFHLDLQCTDVMSTTFNKGKPH